MVEGSRVKLVVEPKEWWEFFTPVELEEFKRLEIYAHSTPTLLQYALGRYTCVGTLNSATSNTPLLLFPNSSVAAKPSTLCILAPFCGMASEDVSITDLSASGIHAPVIELLFSRICPVDTEPQVHRPDIFDEFCRLSRRARLEGPPSWIAEVEPANMS